MAESIKDRSGGNVQWRCTPMERSGDGKIDSLNGSCQLLKNQ
jgi:hypothetical protein